MTSVCVITARGGSKRIPRKNIKDFLGKPIIAYSIDVALKSGLFDEVMVSTDDSEIAEVAKSYGAKVPFMRSDKNSDDYTGTLEVLNEVLEEYKKQGKQFNYLCCFYPTSPLVNVQTLTKGLELLTKGAYNTTFPVCAYSTPIQRALKITNGKIGMFHPEYRHTRSQDLEPAYHDAAQFYWFDIAKTKEDQRVYSDNSGVLVLEDDVVQDIDNQRDWKLAELKYKLLHAVS
jgi:N-acylneuraminate cytidylyltransferase